jgi:hypothetical protein
MPVADILKNRPVCEALLQLVAVSDECCVNVGLPSVEPLNDFEDLANSVLEANSGATLGAEVDRSRCIVHPKMHTPQKGITIRSLSHNLALCAGGDMSIRWETIPSAPENESLNLLLLPWPFSVAPRQFRALEPAHGSLLNIAEKHGFFCFEATRAQSLVDRFDAVLARAEQLVGGIDGVICPELALTASEHQDLRGHVLPKNMFLVSGISECSVGPKAGRNYVSFDVPLSAKHYATIEQPKHHRWCLDKAQILQYGLGGQLHPTTRWWEHIAIEDRRVAFVAMRPWLASCVLICEDLARQDPLAEIVRSIGPNLVIALLMDGPQFRSRWSARYATVLAEDPGSSVLTLTSLGMSLNSRPANTKESRIVALWKDATTPEAREIELSKNGEGVVLSLSVEYLNEWTADGRDDGGNTGYPLLSGVHEVSRA